MTEQHPKALLMVLCDCTDAARDDEFNEWYDRVHLPDILALPGVARARRYRNARGKRAGESIPQYLTVYEIEGENPQDVVRNLVATLPEREQAGRMIDCLNIKFAATYVPIET